MTGDFGLSVAKENSFMDKQMVWKDEYNIGVEIIDREHQRLFRIVNKLLSLEEEKNNPRIYQEGVKYLKEHALKHFLEEERYMASIGYEELEMHRRIHTGFREDTLPALEQELMMENYSPEAVEHFLGVCAGWLIGHTLTEDLAMTGEKMSKWVDLLPDQEIEMMRKVIQKLLHDMFQLDAQAISDTYGGERFGNGVYYRLVYGTEKEDKNWEIILAFEEKILINTVGKIMGLRSGRLDFMLVNAVRYTAKQFVWRVMQHFPALKLYELKEENLLTYDQFSELFEQKKPQVSLLFNTNEGYFSYCVFAPHLLSDGIGTSIGVRNARKEIEKFLSDRDEDPKNKVLVVDDSMTIRQGMKNLLGSDYEVCVAESGVSAIRAISLDRPDMILMDYEMPVCDGRSVMEMLRSEEDFADIPVIFLTSRDDMETVRKVLELKPEGYLLKSLHPTYIKKRIDQYFKTGKL